MNDAFEEDQSLMNKSQALIYYTDKLAKHGWHITAIFSIEDVKDYISGGVELVEKYLMPSDDELNKVCSEVAKEYVFEDYDMVIEWAGELAHQIIKKEQE